MIWLINASTPSKLFKTPPKKSVMSFWDGQKILGTFVHFSGGWYNVLFWSVFAGSMFLYQHRKSPPLRNPTCLTLFVGAITNHQQLARFRPAVFPLPREDGGNLMDPVTHGWLESADKIPWLWNFGSSLIFSFLAIDHTSSWRVSEDSWRFPQWAAHEVFAGNFTINWYTRRPMAHRKQQRNARRKIFP